MLSRWYWYTTVPSRTNPTSFFTKPFLYTSNLDFPLSAGTTSNVVVTTIPFPYFPFEYSPLNSLAPPVSTSTGAFELKLPDCPYIVPCSLEMICSSLELSPKSDIVLAGFRLEQRSLSGISPAPRPTCTEAWPYPPAAPPLEPLGYAYLPSVLLPPDLDLSQRDCEKRGLMLAALTAMIPTNC
jgi:hypothetical protein